MNFADEFVQAAEQVAKMMALMNKINNNTTSLVFNTDYGRIVLLAVPPAEPVAPQSPSVPPVVEEMDASAPEEPSESNEPTPEGD